MSYELLFITLLSLGICGCTGINKSIKAVPVQEKNISTDDKVWIEAKTSKIWVNPHVDESGDMVEGHYKYTVMVPGHWAVKDEDGKK